MPTTLRRFSAGVLIAVLAQISWAQSAGYQSSGVTSTWKASPAAGSLVAAPLLRTATTPGGGNTRLVSYLDTSLTACPQPQSLRYFWHYEDVPEVRAQTWCGAADAHISYVNAHTTPDWHLPYILESCVPGVEWYYSHGLRYGDRYYSLGDGLPSRDINMLCEVADQIEPAPPLPESENNSFGCMREGNPISPSTGEKKQVESDFLDSGAHPLHLLRTFRSIWATGSPRTGTDPGMGGAWTHNHAISLNLKDGVASITAGGEGVYTFSQQMVDGQVTWVAAAGPDKLVQSLYGYAFMSSEDDSVWHFDTTGKLRTVTQRNGWVMSYTYSAERLAQVRNQFGRTLSFAYDLGGMLANVTAPDGQIFRYAYDTGTTLSRVSYADGTSRSYLYENGSFPFALTGIIDEKSIRFASFAYDGQVRGIRTEHAGGADRYEVAYQSDGSSAAVTDPIGTVRLKHYAQRQGKSAVIDSDRPPAIGPAIRSRQQANDGLLISETDFLGVTTEYTWDSLRQLKLSVTKAAGRTEEQARSTQWHPTFRLPVLVTEAGRSVAYTYDARGNLLDTTITDTATGQTRNWAWSWTAQGLLASETDPRGQVWNFEYDGVGNRTLVRDPLGYESRYTYNGAGRLLAETIANRASTSFVWDSRGRLTSRTTSGETTSYFYEPNGLLAKVSLPNGNVVSYVYDSAQRLTSVSDLRGASVQYTLDPAGNRTRETVGDNAGAITLITTRAINSLNRVESIGGASSLRMAIGYDANGEPISQTDGLNQTNRQTLDGLGRPTATIFADNTSAAQSWNPLDQLTGITDPKGVATRYATNAFGEVMSETSPDIGTIEYTRDAAGNITSSRDARGQITSITRDAMGRPVEIRYAADHIATFAYNAAGDLMRIEDKSGATVYTRDTQGRVTGKTQDVNDNPNSPSRFRIEYSYEAGQLAGITYPSGMKVFYRRSHGRITGIDVQKPGISASRLPPTPFASSLTHTALGQPKAWNWSNGDSAARSFDADGRMTANEFASYGYDAASRITSITQQLYVQGTGTVYTTPLAFTAGYDSRNRLTSFIREGAETRYSYDANSNRLTAMDLATSQTNLDGVRSESGFARITSQNLNIDGTSNRLLGFNQSVTTRSAGRTLATVNTPVSYTVDANGSMTSDGLRTFEYDASNRLAKVSVFKDGEAASVSYLHNALGQRVFKGEYVAEQTLPDEAVLGASFIDWLKRNFGWMFVKASASTSIGTAFIYGGDNEIPAYALLAEYDNGSAVGNGRNEYVYLPTDDGSALLMGVLKGNQLHPIHTDHLGTPRLMTNDLRTVVWQRPYSAFGTTEPSGPLKASADPTLAAGGQPMLVRTNPPVELNVRESSQYEDQETGLRYNFLRSLFGGYRYTQFDPIGQAGGLNGYIYIDANPLGDIDPTGLVRQFAKPIDLLPLEGGGGGMSGGGARPANFSPVGSGRQGAFNEAKRINDIPTSQQPVATRLNTDLRGNPQPGRQYDFDVQVPGGGTQRMTLRDDARGHNFGPGNPQNRGPHFNDMCGRHYDY
jgi:RHS repeat-associated protein